MKKSIFSFLLMAVMMLSMASGTSALSSEPDVMPCYNYTSTYSVDLTYTGSNLSGTASITGYPGVTTQINMVMTLQKKGLLRWNDESSNYDYTIFSDTASLGNLYTVGSGTYRLKVVFTVYSGSASETITAYSDTLKI